MRPMRERFAQPRLTAGMDADERWEAAPCRNQGIAYLWDLGLDNDGRWTRAETKDERRDRHEHAKALCRKCPALELCAALPTSGLAGVIAGRVIQ